MKNNIPKELYNAAGIYEIRNLVNGKVYIGSTINFYQRYVQHRQNMIGGKRGNLQLRQGVKKYGIDNFSYAVIIQVERLASEVDKDFSVRLVESENKYIVDLKSNDRAYGYNVRLTAESNLGFKFNDEQLARMRNRKFPDSWLENRKIYGARGSRMRHAKLSEETAKEIKGLYQMGYSIEYLHKKYSVSRQVISLVCSYKGWAHVTFDFCNILKFKELRQQLKELISRTKYFISKGYSVRLVSQLSGMRITLVKELAKKPIDYKINEVYEAFLSLPDNKAIIKHNVGAHINGNRPKRCKLRVLTLDKIAEIRYLMGQDYGSKYLSELYGISVSMVHLLVKDRTDVAPKKPKIMPPFVRKVHKLTASDIPKIREYLNQGKQQGEVAKEFGVSGGTISMIAKGKAWAHVQ